MNAHVNVESSHSSARLAFTLIELLVVIAIIAILAALLLPTLAKAKGKAQSIACLSNVKQWSLAFWMYEDDHEDYFPYEGTPAALDDPANANAWYISAAPYMSQPTLLNLYQQGQAPARGHKSVFVCPAATNHAAPTIAKPIFFYGFNNRMDPIRNARFKRTYVRHITDTVVFTENNETSFPSSSGVYTPARHDRRANLAFADGHAASTPYTDFHRNSSEDNAAAEFSKPRKVYWFPYPTAPN